MDNQFLTEKTDIENVWKETGYLNGISDSKIRQNTAVLLENQRLFNRLNESSGTDSSDIARFSRISIPLVRRIYPQLIANKIVSVQPLLGPTGLVYYLRFRYSSNKGAMRGLDNSGGFPGDDSSSLMQRASGDGNLSVFYTHQQVENEPSSVDAGTDTASVFAPLEHTPVIAGTVTGTIFVGNVAVQTFNVSENNTFTFSDINSPATKVTSASLDLVTGELVLNWNSAPGTNSVVLSYEYNMECNQDLPEINLAMENETISAKTRKVKAAWSFEGQQDLRSQHNLDMEEELTSVLGQEISLETDREILGDLLNNAGTVSAWDFATAAGDTIKEKYESLFVKLVEISNVVHRKTLRGGCNWIVTSPEVASIFETATAGFAPAPSDGFTGGLGIQYVGSISSKWKLYKDPLFKTNQILMGYKGDSYMDSGYFFCPYVPLTQTPVVMDPESLCPRKGLMTRYGKKLLREGAKFYSRLSISNYVI